MHTTRPESRAVSGPMVTLMDQNKRTWGGKKQLSGNSTNARHHGKIFHCNQIVLGTMGVKGRTALDSGQTGGAERRRHPADYQDILSLENTPR